MADMKSTVTANVDCTALIQADLAALLFELVGDLRERCKRLENMNAAIDGMHSEAVQKRDQLRQELDDCHVEISVRSLERQELQRELADAKVQVVNERNEFREQLSQVTAERDAARQQHLVECRKYNAEVERRLALEKRVAELSGNAGELPAEPAPEPYQWKVGDVIACGSVHTTIEQIDLSMPVPWIIFDNGSRQTQGYWQAIGWKLYRKASDLGVQQLTPRQVEISDSTGTDGEGQS